MISDSDMFSMRLHVSNWVQAAPSTIDGLDNNHYTINSTITLDNQSLLNVPIPNTKLGTLWSAQLSDSRVAGLYITEHNVRSLLQLAEGVNQNPENSQRAARELFNFLTQRDDILSLSEEDLNSLEEKLTGKASIEDDIE
jgi:hypothetical protein